MKTLSPAQSALSKIRRINRRLRLARGADRKRLMNKRADAVISYIKALRLKTISTSFLRGLLL